jgi:mRNA interferase RelE/StbE
MPYEVILTEEAERFLKKCDNSIKPRILNKLDCLMLDPRLGKPLTANLTGLWSLRCGDYRIIYQIKDNELLVVIIDIGHRKDIYD